MMYTTNKQCIQTVDVGGNEIVVNHKSSVYLHFQERNTDFRPSLTQDSYDYQPLDCTLHATKDVYPFQTKHIQKYLILNQIIQKYLILNQIIQKYLILNQIIRF